MKASEFRKLIREEISRVLGEQSKVLKNVKAYTEPSVPKSRVQKLFGSFLSIKQGPTKKDYANNYVVDLDVDALLSLLKSNKDYGTVNPSFALDVYYKGHDSISFEAESLPKDVISALAKAGDKVYDAGDENLLTLQIGSDRDGFEFPEKYNLPPAVKSAVGEFNSSADAEDEDAYSDDIDAYLAKIEKALLIVGKKLVPGMKKYAKEDGFITFKLPAKLDAQTKTKIKTLFKGVKSIEF